MNDGIRTRLVEAAIGLLERSGLAALSVRNLAAEVGTSTMVVYTHFGGMNGVIEAIADEVFHRFAAALTAVPTTDDPVADFLLMGAAYRQFALAHPQRYQLMFGTTSPPSLSRHRSDVTVASSVSDKPEWAVSFDALRDAVRRMIAAGRIRDDDELAVAGRMWSISHGAVMLELVGFFGHEGHGLTEILGPVTLDTLVGMGDDRERAEQSLAAAISRFSASQLP